MKTRTCPQCGHPKMDRSSTVALDQCPKCDHVAFTPQKYRRASTSRVPKSKPLDNSIGNAFAALNLNPTPTR